MKKIFFISKDNHSGLVRKLTIVHEYMHFTDNSFFDKGSFNNYVDKMRGGGGGQKMSVFVHTQGIKTVHAGGWVKKWQNSVHVVVECALRTLSTKSTGPLEGLKIRGCQYYLVGIICPPPLIEIGLTDLPKSGGVMAPPGVRM